MNRIADEIVGDNQLKENRMGWNRGIFVLAALLLLLLWSTTGAAATTGAATLENDNLFEDYETEVNIPHVPDPLYWFNQGMYRFNDKLYFWGLKPLASGYRRVTPAALRRGVKNFFHHTLFPVRFVNSLLQGKVSAAGRECSIFLINTMGSLGFERIAQDEYGLKSSREDLGQTLGRYGLGQGVYLVLPFFGPSTLRDFAGRIGDYFLDPVGYVEPVEATTGLVVLDVVNDTSLRIGDYEALKEAAFDPYTAMKDGYLQLRANRVKE